MHAPKFDLEDRLLDFSVRIIRVTESMNRTKAGQHLADQLLRSGTSPYGQHGEAEGAESRDDFIHKMRVCHKELREARRWLRLIKRRTGLEAAVARPIDWGSRRAGANFFSQHSHRATQPESAALGR